MSGTTFDPDKNLNNTKPDRPDLQNVIDAKYAEDLAAWNSRPEDVRGAQPERTTATATPAQESSHRLLLEDFKAKEREFLRVSAGLKSIMDWIFETVPSSWISLTPSDGMIRDTLVSLRERAARTITQRTDDVR